MKTFNEVRQSNKEVNEAKSAIVWKVKPPKGQKNIHPDSKWPGMKPGDIKKMNEGLDEAKTLDKWTMSSLKALISPLILI